MKKFLWVLLVLALVGCDGPLGSSITVTGVTVNTATATVEKGGTRQFTAVVEGENGPSQGVTWEVEGGSTGTSINDNGILTAAADETAETLTVKATSRQDRSKFGTATVTVVEVGSVTVAFNANGGDPTPDPIQILKGSSMGEQYPAYPEKDGYTFDGWYNGSTKYTRDTIISFNMTLTAQWAAGSPTYYTVTFNTAGGSTAPSPIQVQAGSSIGSANFPAAPTRAGYVFAGWYDGTTQYTYSTEITSTVTLTAQWTELITVTFNTDGGTAVASIQIAKDSAMGDQYPVYPTKAGFTFGGWYVGDTKYERTTLISDTITLTAVWTAGGPTYYTVSFDTNGGGTNPSDIPVQANSSIGSASFPANPIRAGYTFVGWFYNGTQYTYSTEITSNVTLTARWTEVAVYITVTFNADGGEPTPEPIIIVRNTSMGDQYPTYPAKAGYVFSGWYSETIKYEQTTPISADIMLTAAWTAGAPTYYTVTFNSDGGSAVSPIQVQANSSIGSVNFPAAPTRTGYRFDGWFSGSTQYTYNTEITSDVTLTAQWTAVVTVTFDTNGGSMAPSPVTINQNASLGASFPANPTRTGYLFGGWFSGSTQYTSASTISSSITLTARWINTSGGESVTTWNGLSVAGTTTASKLSGEADILRVNTGSEWSKLTYSLNAYAGQTVSISLSARVWLETAAPFAWQVNNSGYSTVAGSTNNNYSAGQWHTITGTNSSVAVASGNVLYLSQPTSTTLYITDLVVTINGNVVIESGVQEEVTITPNVSSWRTLTVPSQTTATLYSSHYGKTDVLEVIPNGSYWATLSRSLASYSSEVTVSVSVDVWLETASKIAWQANIGSGETATYPTIAGNTSTNLSAGEWHTVSGSANITPTSGTSLYLSGDQLGSATIYLANFTATISDGAWVDPLTQTTQLTGGQTITMQWYGDRGSHGEGQALGYLPGMSNSSNEPYHYEMWLEGPDGTSLAGVSDITFNWYGADQGGSSAFRTEWRNNPKDYLARIGYFWGGNNGPNFNTLNNVYMDFNYTRAPSRTNAAGSTNTAGSYSYIGAYGWARNSSATVESEKLIEFYIVEDWFGNQYYPAGTVVGPDTIMSGKSGTIYYPANQNYTASSGQTVTYENTGQTFTVDGANYVIFKATRYGPSIAGDTWFTQIFSVRQTMRQAGTISVNKHFEEWTKLTGLQFANMYDLKFLVESGGGEGWLDFRWLKLSREDTPR